jgi:zinc finger CCHC domain-containing protein 8
MEESSVDSIEELESRRKALLAELESEESENGKEAEVPLPCDKETKEDNTSSNDSPLESDWKSLKSPSHGHCRHQEMGTPVSIRFSPYSTLPDREKFSRDMGEMIPFENLPNTTGTFQKMKSLLDKVRNLFKRK